MSPGKGPLVAKDWVRHLPKAEVHVHLEGCVPDEVVAPGRPAGEVRSLAQLLQRLDYCCGLVSEGGQLEEIAYRLAERAARSGARHVDAIVNPTHWPRFCDRLPEMLESLDAGFGAGERDHETSAALCVSLRRDQSGDEATSLVDRLVALGHPRVRALSIDGDEAGGANSNNERFAPAFARAAEAGLHRCAHAGESSGPAGVREAIELLGAERIDHGIRCLEDPAVTALVVERAVPLDVCPSSNVRLGLVADMESHPLPLLLGAGVRCSLNTDDPVLYGIDLAGEYLRAAEAFGWGMGELERVARTSIESCFAPDGRRAELVAELDSYLARTGFVAPPEYLLPPEAL